MRSKHLVLVVFGLLTFQLVYAQDISWKNWGVETLGEIQESTNYTVYTKHEKQVAFYINLLRSNPKQFKTDILIPFVESNNIQKEKAYKSLLRELDKTPSLPLLMPHDKLYESAIFHAKDMGKSGKIGHKSSRGKSYEKRMQPLMSTFSGVGENCHYGSDDALFIVIDLLIDKGIPGYGHRKNLLNPDFEFVGIGIQAHKKYGVNCVQEFAGSLQ